MKRSTPFSIAALRLHRPSLFGFVILVLTLTIIPLRVAKAAAGDLDPSFGTGGKAITNVRPIDEANAIAIQPDGKIVAAGIVSVNESFKSDIALLRYDVYGHLDPTFGLNGLVTADLSGHDDWINAVAIQPDGKIIIAGYINDFAKGTGYDFLLLRYNPNGGLDTTFGTGGKVITDFANAQNDLGTAMVIQPNGKILVAGYTGFLDSNNEDFAIARYNSDGSLDTAFGNGGRVITDFLGSNDEANAMKLQSDGKIVLAGWANTQAHAANTYPDYNANDFAVARYNPNGSLDTTFGIGGKATTDFVGFRDISYALGILSDGRIVAGGLTSYDTDEFNTDFALVVYTPTGQVDTSFGSNGKVTADFSLPDPDFASEDAVSALAVDANDRIVVTGGAHSSYALLRYNPDGTLDTSFGAGGKVLGPDIGEEIYNALVIQPDGKLVTAGFTVTPMGGVDFILARFYGTATNAPLPPPPPTPFDLCLQDDGNGNLLQINTTSGAYQFASCSGQIIGGTGTVTRKGASITFQQSAGSYRVLAKIDLTAKKATASLQVLSTGRTYSITDRDITNNTCSCK